MISLPTLTRITSVAIIDRMPKLASITTLSILCALAGAVGGFLACAPSDTPRGTGARTIAPGRPVILVTYSVLAAAVSDLVGDSFDVRSLVPNGLDVHEWEPSARDMAALAAANLVVENGLGLEAGLEKALEQARRAGVPFFTAADHIVVRTVGAGEDISDIDPDQVAGARDPHLWTDPLAVRDVARALAARLRADFAVNLSDRLSVLERDLETLDAEIRAAVDAIQPDRRTLVTGHESLGYFAARYGLRLLGAIVPSLSTQAEESAANLAALKKLIGNRGARVIFIETGTPARTAAALARETGARAVPLVTHAVPPDNRYVSFARKLATDIVEALK